jgi:DNA-directed RNA polymerase subunit RPC12/RpoP
MICPQCKSSRFFQTEDPNRFICLDCKAEFELKPVEKQNRQQKY